MISACCCQPLQLRPYTFECRESQIWLKYLPSSVVCTSLSAAACVQRLPKTFFYLHISSKHEMFCGPSCVTPKQYCNRFAYLVAVHSARMSAAKEFDLKKSNHSHLLQAFSDGNCFEQVTGQKIDHLCTTAVALYVH